MVEATMTTLPDLHSERFKALGHPVRLAILRRIVQGPVDGTPVGAIQEAVGIPGSTLSHHLACLAETGLVLVEREGTTLRYRAHFEALHQLTEYLWLDCCKGGPGAAGCASSEPGCCTATPGSPKA
jgi:ArsR family transcriptional regulator, arsenate/arsenite/antimonite-responsive transcriptional repressor